MVLWCSKFTYKTQDSRSRKENPYEIIPVLMMLAMFEIWKDDGQKRRSSIKRQNIVLFLLK